jgi:hypothetical protein
MRWNARSKNEHSKKSKRGSDSMNYKLKKDEDAKSSSTVRNKREMKKCAVMKRKGVSVK